MEKTIKEQIGTEKKTYDERTRYVWIEFKELPSRTDLEIMYRIIRTCLLADISIEDEKEMVQDDMNNPTHDYYFVVRDCYYLREGMEMMHRLIDASFNSSVRSTPFDKQAKWLEAKEQAKLKAEEEKLKANEEKKANILEIKERLRQMANAMKPLYLTLQDIRRSLYDLPFDEMNCGDTDGDDDELI